MNSTTVAAAGPAAERPARAPARDAPAASPGAPGPDAVTRLRSAGERLLGALVERLSVLAREQVDDLAASLEGVAENGGVGLGAAFGAGRAALQGRNVLLGALRGGFAALGAAARVLVVVVLALAPVLLVLALVALIVALLVWAVVAAVRAVTA